MKFLWVWIHSQFPHTCEICREQIATGEGCWRHSEFDDIIRDWVHQYLCYDCRRAVPAVHRQPSKPEQMSML